MCGLFGVTGLVKPKSDIMTKMIRALGKASEVRGTDAGGISFNINDALVIQRASGAVSTNNTLNGFENARSVMGHTRLTTQGNALINENNHPFPSRDFAFAHNGTLYNDDEIAKHYKFPNTVVQTDSYVVVRMLEELHGGVLNADTIKDVVEKIEGVYNFTFLDREDNIWIVKNDNPLAIYRLNDLGIIAYASTDDIMHEALDDFYEKNFLDKLMSRKRPNAFATKIHVEAGDILKITPSGMVERHSFTPYAQVTTEIMGVVYRYGTPKYYHYDYTNAYAPAVYNKYDSIMSDYTSYVLFHNGSELEVGKVLYTEAHTGSYYVDSRLKGYTMTLTDDDIIDTLTGKELKTTLTIQDMYLNARVFDNLMGYLSNIVEWKTLSDMIKEEALYGFITPIQASQLKEAVTSAIYSRWAEVAQYDVFLAQGDSKITPPQLVSVRDFIKVLLHSSKSTTGTLQVQELYARAQMWNHLMLGGA